MFFFFSHLSVLNCESHSSLMFCIFFCQGLRNFVSLDQFGDFCTIGALKIRIPHSQLLFPHWRFNLSSMRYRALQLLWAIGIILLLFPCHGFNRPSWQSSSPNSLPFSSWESFIFSCINVQSAACSPKPLYPDLVSYFFQVTTG